MKITFGINGVDGLISGPVCLPYENVNYWSKIMNSLRKHDETRDTFVKRLNDEWSIRLILDSSGITGVELEDSTLSMLIMRYPPR